MSSASPKPNVVLVGIDTLNRGHRVQARKISDVVVACRVTLAAKDVYRLMKREQVNHWWLQFYPLQNVPFFGIHTW